MIRVLAEQRTVYRSEVGRRGRLTRRAAYLDAAWQAWRAKYPCECELETGFVCWQHHPDENGTSPDTAVVARRRKVIDRLARWLMWRDARAARRQP